MRSSGWAERLLARPGLGALAARHRRVAVPALAAALLATAAVVAVTTGGAFHPSVAVTLGHAGQNSGTGSAIAELADPGSKNVNSVAFSPDGKTLATGDQNGNTYLWDVATRTRTATLTDPGGGDADADAAAFSPDGKTLAIADFSGNTFVWNVATRTEIATLTDRASQGVESAAFSPDGKILATSDQNGLTYLWDISEGRSAP